MKENYTQAILEITLLSAEDILTTSGDAPLDSENNHDPSGWT